MASLELGSGTTRGQGAFREGPPEGEAGQGCARPVADVPGSVAERGSTSICLPSRPVCCCEGSPVPAESHTPRVGFSSEPSLGSLWEGGVQTLRRHMESGKAVRHVGRRCDKARLHSCSHGRSPALLISEKADFPGSPPCGSTNSTFQRRPGHSEPRPPRLPRSPRPPCLPRSPRPPRLPPLSSTSTPAPARLDLDACPPLASTSTLPPAHLDLHTCPPLSCEGGSIQAGGGIDLPQGQEACHPLSGRSAVRRALAFCSHMPVDDLFPGNSLRKAGGTGGPPPPAPTGNDGALPRAALGHPRGTTWLMRSTPYIFA